MKTKIKGLEIEYENHIYHVEGLKIPSVSDIIKKTSKKYKLDNYNDSNTISDASILGDELHKEIEEYENLGICGTSVEFNSYLRYKEMYNLNVLYSEKICILLDDDGIPICCGHPDLIVCENGNLMVLEIKRTSKLYEKKVMLQLNLYRILAMETYGIEINNLAVIRLRDYDAEFVDVPIDPYVAFDALNEFIVNFDFRYNITKLKNKYLK